MTNLKQFKRKSNGLIYEKKKQLTINKVVNQKPKTLNTKTLIDMMFVQMLHLCCCHPFSPEKSRLYVFHI